MVTNAKAPGKVTNLASSQTPAISLPEVVAPKEASKVVTPVELPVETPKPRRGRPKKDAE